QGGSLCSCFFCLMPVISHGAISVLHASAGPRPPHSLPTRRSSDLSASRPPTALLRHPDRAITPSGSAVVRGVCIAHRSEINGSRLEEHTSELQSRENLVCRRLLEKKKCRARADGSQT